MLYTYFTEPASLKVVDVPLLEIRKDMRLARQGSHVLPGTLATPDTDKMRSSIDGGDADHLYVEDAPSKRHDSHTSFTARNAVGIPRVHSLSSNHTDILGVMVVPALRTEYGIADRVQADGSKATLQVLTLALERVDACDKLQKLWWGPFGFMRGAWKRADRASISRLERIFTTLYMDEQLNAALAQQAGGDQQLPGAFQTFGMFGRAMRTQAQLTAVYKELSATKAEVAKLQAQVAEMQADSSAKLQAILQALGKGGATPAVVYASAPAAAAAVRAPSAVPLDDGLDD